MWFEAGAGAGSGEAAPLRDAATVVLLRDPGGAATSERAGAAREGAGADGGGAVSAPTSAPEILLLRRRSGDAFAAGAWVFPGGAVDAGDRELPARRWRGLDPVAAAARLRLSPAAALGAHVAGVRETFEEAGVLLAGDDDGRPADPRSPACRALRAALADRRGARSLAGLLADAGLVLDLGALEPFARWMTPRPAPRRFDAVFFAARAPADQAAGHDADETVEHQWLTARAALAAHRRDALPMMHPTIKTLEWLAAFTSADDALAAASATPMEPVLPHVERRGGELRVLHPRDEGYPDELRAEMEART